MKDGKVFLDNDYLVCLYTIRENGDFLLYYCFDSRGMVEREVQEKVYLNLIGNRVEEGVKWLGPFSELPILNKFSYQLCEKLGRQKVCLISMQEFNEALEESTQAPDVLPMIFKNGDIMENLGRKKRASALAWFSN